MICFGLLLVCVSWFLFFFAAFLYFVVVAICFSVTICFCYVVAIHPCSISLFSNLILRDSLRGDSTFLVICISSAVCFGVGVIRFALYVLVCCFLSMYDCVCFFGVSRCFFCVSCFIRLVLASDVCSSLNLL